MRYPTGASFSPPIPRLGHFGKRDSPGGIGTTNHKGVDYALPLGTRLVAVAAGEVIYRGYLGGWGNHVKLQHKGFRSTYSHMQSSTAVKLGQKLSEGDKVGNVGMTGNTTGPHVHFEILIDGVYVDPEKYLAARVAPTQQSGGGATHQPSPATPGTTPTPATPTLEGDDEMLIIHNLDMDKAKGNPGAMVVVSGDRAQHVDSDTDAEMFKKDFPGQYVALRNGNHFTVAMEHLGFKNNIPTNGRVTWRDNPRD